MSAWAYCLSCDASLPKPTVRELFEKRQVCHSCRSTVEPTGDLADAIEELEAKVEWLMSLAREVGREM